MQPTQPDLHPPAPDPAGTLDRALALVRFLRANCPWDAAQTPRSLTQYLLEEAYETVDAIVREDDAELQDELGDLLLNLAFQVVLAEERSAFGAPEVAATLERKMRRRHPHLWGLGPAESWGAIKERERGGQTSGLLDSVSAGLEPLLRAQRMQERAAEVGFDWPDASGALAKVSEEADELGAELVSGNPERLADEVGDLLFSVVNLARLVGTNANSVLTAANAKFARRFAALEALATERDLVIGDLSLETLDELWNEVKRQERLKS